MGQSLSRIAVHLCFSTKQRQRWIDSQLQPELEAYLGGVLTHHDCPVLQIKAMPDHVHLLFVLGRTTTLAGAVEELKKESSKWAKRKGAQYGDFQWQGGYGAFSVSKSSEPAVVQYIDAQEEHHRRMSFEEELRVLLDRHGVTYDERYVWD